MRILILTSFITVILFLGYFRQVLDDKALSILDRSLYSQLKTLSPNELKYFVKSYGGDLFFYLQNRRDFNFLNFLKKVELDRLFAGLKEAELFFQAKDYQKAFFKVRETWPLIPVIAEITKEPYIRLSKLKDFLSDFPHLEEFLKDQVILGPFNLELIDGKAFELCLRAAFLSLKLKACKELSIDYEYAPERRWLLANFKKADLYKVLKIKPVELVYATPYIKVVFEMAELKNISKAFVYAVIKTESNFNPKTISNAGAHGLMQVMPNTALGIAKKEGLKNPTKEELLEPIISLTFGISYLVDLMQRYKNDEVLAMASYNAGPTPVKRWLDRGGDFIEAVAYKETRDYIAKVLLAKEFYKVIYDF